MSDLTRNKEEPTLTPMPTTSSKKSTPSTTIPTPHLQTSDLSSTGKTPASTTLKNSRSNPERKTVEKSAITNTARSWLIRLALSLPVLFALFWVAVNFSGFQGTSTDGVSTFVVTKRKLIDTVVESGTLESQSKVEGICELHGWQNKITFIVEEGATVKKGDVVVRFDASEIETEIAEQKVTVSNEQAAVNEAREQIEVQKNKNDSDIAAAKLEKDLADLDLEKYREGDYIAEVAELDRSIAESKAALEQRSEELKNMRILVKKGYREPERLVQMEQAVKSAKFQVERDEQKKEVLTKFTYKRQITELESKAEEAGRKLQRAEATAKAELAQAKLKLSSAEERLKIEKKELEEELDQLEKAEIKATHSGTVAYANSRWMDSQFRIRPGGNVHRRQTVFHLPDMTRMQVQLEVHESFINKLKVGQRALVKVAPFPDHKLTGRIKKIADLARSDRNSEEKAYTAIVTIDSIPEEVKLRPGMSAETEVHVRTLEDVMAIPVQAVTEIAGKEFVYLKSGTGFNRTEVKIAEGNESFLVLVDGLNPGDVVAMDAYQRGLADIENEGLEESESESQFESEDDAIDEADEPVEEDGGSDEEVSDMDTSDDESNLGKTSEESVN